jgi:hydrogenase maturation protease
MDKTAVIGIGNLLLRDDGVGVHLVQELEKENFSQAYGVELIDGGTYIFDLMDLFIKNQRIIILDSIKGGHAPGTIYRITPEELGGYIKANTSLHDVQVLDLLKNVKLMGYCPQVIIIGIEPAEICFNMELSPIIKNQLTKVIDALKREVKNNYNN